MCNNKGAAEQVSAVDIYEYLNGGKKMKKIIALLLAVVMVACLFAACGGNQDDNKASDNAAETIAKVSGDARKIAFVTDVGNIDDHSFNQYSYEGVTRFAKANGFDCNYYKPAGDTDQDRIDAINQAVNDGYGVVVMAGYLFGPAVAKCAADNPDALFLALDVTTADLGVDTVPTNLALVCYQEEQAGYLAGYATVKDGYKKLGFLGGIDVPAVIRYGYGFVLGADAAAKDMGLTDVEIKYWYSGSFSAKDEIATKMDAWYTEGTEVVFSCGGGIYQSCLSAAEANDGKVIGVDVDQSNESDLIITSAMKALSNSVVLALTAAGDNNWVWPTVYSAQCQYLGAADGCVGLPMDTSKFETFTKADYDTLFTALADGSLVVSNDIANKPVTTNVTVDWQ